MGKKDDALDGFEEAEEDQDTPDGDKELEGFEEAESAPEEPEAEGKGGLATGAAVAAGAAAATAGGSVDVYTKTEEVRQLGFGEKLKNSVVGVFIGFILFIASFYILYRGETRVDRSKIVQGATAIEPSEAGKTAKGTTVKFSGKAATTAPVTDPQYLPGGKFLYLHRTAEMYAWVEESETRTTSGPSTGKKKTTRRTTTYRYVKKWTSNPPNSTHFEKPDGHINPPMNIQSETWAAKPATIGGLTVNLKDARVMGAEGVPEPKPKAPVAQPKPIAKFDPMATKGQGPVRFVAAPAAAKPATTKAFPGKKLLLYVIQKDAYGKDGKWLPTSTTIKVADGLTAKKVKINTTGLKVVDLPGPTKILYKPKEAAKKPAFGNERATVQCIELGHKVTLSGTLKGDTLTGVTLSAKPAAEKAAAPAEPAAPKSPWYIGKGTLSAPQIGDIRLTFDGIKPDAELFVCGEMKGEAVVPTMYKGLAFLLAAEMPENKVISQLQSEHKMWTWVARIAGFLCMWLGMCLMIGPLTFLLSYIPVLGQLASGLIGWVFGIIALVLTLLTITLVRFFWIVLALVVVLVVWAIVRSMKSEPAPE